jgi:NADPH2:quinone reductase
MRALVITADGLLGIQDRPIPVPILDQVVVEVASAGVNRADLMQRAGRYPAPSNVDPDIPGLEFSGIVSDVGPEVNNLQRGDRVFGIVAGGAQAEYVLTRASHCMRVPENIDLIQAGAIPEAFFTAYDALVVQGALQPGEVCCVHAIGSGVGTAAVQLAKWTGATVVGTARTKAKLDLAVDYGLDFGILAEVDFDPATLADAIVACSGGADVTLDLLGGPYVSVDARIAAQRGRIVLAGTLAGATAALPLLPVLSKRLTVIGTVLRSRTATERASLTAEVARHVVPALANEQLRPVIDAIFPIEQAAEAYAILESGDTFGKLLLTF